MRLMREKFWNNLKLQYNHVGAIGYIGFSLVLGLGFFGLSFYLNQMIDVPTLIENQAGFIKIRNDSYAGIGGLLLVGVIPLLPFIIKSFDTKRGRGVGKRYFQFLIVISFVIGIASKLWIDHLLVEAGYHKCKRHEIHRNITDRFERKYPPRAWVLDPADCLEP